MLIDSVADEEVRALRLCELNVVEQVLNVSKTTIVRDAWDRGQEVMLHGWIYGTKDGLLKDLHCSMSSLSDIKAAYAKALALIGMALS